MNFPHNFPSKISTNAIISYYHLKSCVEPVQHSILTPSSPPLLLYSSTLVIHQAGDLPVSPCSSNSLSYTFENSLTTVFRCTSYLHQYCTTPFLSFHWVIHLSSRKGMNHKFISHVRSTGLPVPTSSPVH